MISKLLSSVIYKQKLRSSPSSRFIPFGRRILCNSIICRQKRPLSHWKRTLSTIDLNDNAKGDSGLTLGIMRETYDPWERRTPLTPDHVNMLLRRMKQQNTADSSSLLSKIVIQPSSKRIYTNNDYKSAGAIIDDDLSQCDLILGVKRPKSHTALLPNKSYMFFSHVIKGQSENMDLLQHVLDNNIQLFDYECIIEHGGTNKDIECVNTKSSAKNSSKRLVAFGKYAGIAGMNDTFHVLGRKLLAKGYSTPFLYCPPSYMSYDLNEMHQHVNNMSTRIANKGLPCNLDPLIFTFTGKGGNVNQGVMEIFELLPHEMISKNDLKEIRSMTNDGSTSQKCVYGLMLEQEDLVQHKVLQDTQPFDKQHYRSNPNEYESVFHKTIAPYVNVIVNGMYWDERYPRLLTKEQTRNLFYNVTDNNMSKKPYLSVVSDISCDVNGSIEFLDKTTTIDRPYFQYDPIEKVTSSCMDSHGITVMGVDILPSEVPREASTHFGNALVPLLEKLISTKCYHEDSSSVPSNARNILHFDEEESLLPPELYNACIAYDGSLTNNYRYIETLMDRQRQQQGSAAAIAPSEEGGTVMLLWLEGHLFDTGLINQVLNIIEKHQCHFELKECIFGRNEEMKVLHKSTVLLRVTTMNNNENDLLDIEDKVDSLIHLFDRAEATMKCYKRTGGSSEEDDDDIQVTTTSTVTETSSNGVSTSMQTPSSSSSVTVDESNAKEETVLLLGSGLVSKSCVEFLGRSAKRHIVVASVDEDEAKNVASMATKGQAVRVDLGSDATTDKRQLESMVENANIVVSLLPATMHSKVANVCIDKQTNLVTASYESDDMRSLRDRCANAGIFILNEVGLDPGLDHMSAMKIIDDIHDRGGSVVSFTSVCGGLPAPEAANNPLMYKFSWSPMGVLRASQNSATYMMDDKIINVNGNDLLASAQSFDEAWPTLHLECLPNRDSLIYGKKYGIGDVSTLFRGTLRYHGFSSLMNVFKNIGFFSSAGGKATNWTELLHNLQKDQGYESLDEFLLSCADGDITKAKKAAGCLHWLGMTGSTGANRIIESHKNIVESFCDVLSEKLSFEDNERDMVLMNTSIEATFDDDGGYNERHQSSLQLYGDESMTAMCKTVGFTAAAATDLFLTDNNLQQKTGLVLPTSKEIYLPMLKTLENEGIAFVENTTKVEHPEEKHAF